MTRSQRHSKILEIISNKIIETQDDLVVELNRSGFPTTQATISRDIKELGLIKALTEQGIYKYVTLKGADVRLSSKLITVFREAVISVITTNNMVIVKTLNGSANAVLSVINQLKPSESLGNLAGDDTVLLITANEIDADKLKEKLNKLFE